MVKTGVLTLATIAFAFLAAVGIVFAQTATPTASPTATPTATASPSPTSSPTVPGGAPSTGMGGN